MNRVWMVNFGVRMEYIGMPIVLDGLLQGAVPSSQFSLLFSPSLCMPRDTNTLRRKDK